MKAGDSMSALIIATPLFDGKMAVQAYKLCDHDTNRALDIKGDFRERTQTYYLPGLEIVQEVGLAPFSGDLPLFVATNRFHILTGMISNKEIPPDRLILTLPGTEPVDDELIGGIENLLSKGYGFAIDGYPDKGLSNRMIPFATNIILDFQNKDFITEFNEITQ